MADFEAKLNAPDVALNVNDVGVFCLMAQPLVVLVNPCSVASSNAMIACNR